MSPPLAEERVVAVPMTFHKYWPFEEYPLGFKALRVFSGALGFRRNTPQLQLFAEFVLDLPSLLDITHRDLNREPLGRRWNQVQLGLRHLAPYERALVQRRPNVFRCIQEV